jgi:hypothetical protein
VRAGPALLLVAAAGFALGGCGGGGSGALSTRTAAIGTGTVGTRTSGTVTREVPTREAATQTQTQTVTTAVTTAETLTETATTAITTTTAVTTTAPGPTTTRQHVIGTTATTTVAFTQSTVAETGSSDTSWAWIALGVGLGLAALAIILWALHRRRAGAEAWGKQTAELNRRALVALDDVVAQGSVVTGQIEALASEARTLESTAPDDPSRAAAANVRARLDELASTMQSDRALRLSSPPPSQEQLAYSTAVIRQQAEQLQGVLRPPAATP